MWDSDTGLLKTSLRMNAANQAKQRNLSTLKLFCAHSSSSLSSSFVHQSHTQTSSAESFSAEKVLEQLAQSIITQCLFVNGHTDLLLLSHGIDGLLRLWRVRPPAELLQMDTLQCSAFCCFDPTGTFLALSSISMT